MSREMILVLDFGGQYNQLIARRVRELSVYSEVHPHTMSIEEIKKMNPTGIILTGGPASVYKDDSPKCDKKLFELGIPVLGICYGAQLMTYLLGGKVETADVREYGHTEISTDGTDLLFTGVSKKTVVWMSHTDRITEVAQGFRVTASSSSCPIAAASDWTRKLFLTQFHPEVTHSKEGQAMLANFVRNVCNCRCDWKMSSFVDESIVTLKRKVGNGRTAYDMYLIIREASKYQLLEEIDSYQTYTFFYKDENGEYIQTDLEPTNRFVSKEVKMPSNIKIKSWKTGTTELAGYCLAMILDINDKEYTIVVTDSESSSDLYNTISAMFNLAD